MFDTVQYNGVPHRMKTCQLMIFGRWQESAIKLAMQCIELDEWEEGIDWQGLAGSDNEVTMTMKKMVQYQR